MAICTLCGALIPDNTPHTHVVANIPAKGTIKVPTTTVQASAV